jgi:AmmeMemoRadiSam system protein B
VQTKYEENEHSLEMHLPYISKIFSENKILLLPLMVGSIPSKKLPDYAKALLPYFMDERTLFVVSSDFCHWGERFDFTH